MTHTERVIKWSARCEVEPLGRFLEDMAWQLSLLRPLAIHLGYTRPGSDARRTGLVFENVAGAEGFEPSALGFGDRCSDQAELRPFLAESKVYPDRLGSQACLGSTKWLRPNCPS